MPNPNRTLIAAAIIAAASASIVLAASARHATEKRDRRAEVISLANAVCVEQHPGYLKEWRDCVDRMTAGDKE